jgi:hypothetical protein
MGTGIPYSAEQITVPLADSGDVGLPLTLFARGNVTIEGSVPLTWTPCDGATGVYHAAVTITGTLNETVVSVDTILYTLDSPSVPYCSTGPGMYQYDAAAHVVYVHIPGDFPPGTNTYVSVWAHGFEINTSHVTVTGFTVSHTSGAGIHVRGTDTHNRVRSVIVKSCTTAFNKRNGVLFEYASLDSVLSTRAYNNVSHGFCLRASDNCYLAYNESFKNDNPLQCRGGVVGFKIGDGDTNAVETTSAPVTNTVLEYNSAHNNEDSGFEVHGAYNILVRRNVAFCNQDHGFDNQLANGVVYQNDDATRNDHDGMSVEDNADNVEVYNSILSANAVYPFTLKGPDGIRELFVATPYPRSGPHGGFLADNNIVVGLAPTNWLGNNACLGTLGSYYRTTVEYNGSQYASLDLFCTAHPELCGNSWSSDPRFADSSATGGDLRIRGASSDALDGAATARSDWLAWDARGFGPHDGNHSNTGSGNVAYADIGAYEDLPPGPVADLRGDMANDTSIHLAWTATPDDWTRGTADAAADLRYAQTPIIGDGSFSSATQDTGEPSPAAPGTLQGKWITNLSMCTRYYFGLKFTDANNNTSSLGDTASYFTTGIWQNGHWNCDDGSRAQINRNGSVSAIRGRSDGPEGADGHVVASTAVTPTAGNVAIAEVVPSASSLVVKLAYVDAGAAAGQREGVATGVYYATPDANEGWSTRLLYSLPGEGTWVLLSPDRPGRWTFTDPMTINALNPAPVVLGTSWQLVEATNSQVGDVTQLLVGGGLQAALSVGDTLIAHYSVSGAADDSTPSWLLSLSKSASSAAVTRAAGPGHELASSVPTAFALYQNRPNPLVGRTTFRFDLPRPETSCLEVFDITGRRVRVLINAWMPAGRHSIDWDARDRQGRSINPGAYICRLRAGSFRAERKLVVLP